MDNELVKILKAYAFERLRLQKKWKREPKSQEKGSRFLLVNSKNISNQYHLLSFQYQIQNSL